MDDWPLPMNSSAMPVDYTGLAISSDGSLMVVSDSEADQLEIFRTDDGGHVRSLGGPGTGPGEFNGPLGFCMTPHNTVLVAECANKRIQEVTLEGAHVKSIPVRGWPFSVAVHGDLVAVARKKRSIELYNYTAGALVRAISVVKEAGDYMQTVCFAPDGEHLAVKTMRGYIALVSVDGQFVRHVGLNTFWEGVAFTCTGYVIGVGEWGHGSVFSATDGKLLRSWATDCIMDSYEFEQAQICYSKSVTVLGNRLYIMYGGKVYVFE